MLVQVSGSLLVLFAYLAVARGACSPRGVAYLLANAVGATLLAVDAWHLRQWGFLLLEATWALVALHGLIRRP